MNKTIAKILRWPALIVILVIIAAEWNGSIALWAMGLILIPVGLLFIYLWQLASRR